MKFSLGCSHKPTHQEVHDAVHSCATFIRYFPNDYMIPLDNCYNVMDHLLGVPSSWSRCETSMRPLVLTWVPQVPFPHDLQQLVTSLTHLILETFPNVMGLVDGASLLNQVYGYLGCLILGPQQCKPILYLIFTNSF